ncbi:hypothetical protein ACI6PS_02380 [Flavobacterium sp. PLA-1-15]|uniref:hypothetical protein n=1 Tax=Flavobacterium sp. PLA-1-15 TaxID=3380533 RepID=UPI003B8245F8
MSLRKQPWMKKGTRVLALLQEGTITGTRDYVLAGQRFVYLILVQIKGTDKPEKYHPQDVEQL